MAHYSGAYSSFYLIQKKGVVMGLQAKRIFDLVGSALLLLCLFPILLLIAIMIRTTSAGPIFFVQERVGQHGKRFRMFKFRTMGVGADTVSTPMHESDPIITPVGRFLRRFSLDELPQLWNVLLGEMSLIGPRPMLPKVADNLPPELRRRHAMRPGLTGLAQVRGRNALSWSQRIAIDIEYVDNWSLLLDLTILLQTVGTVISGRGLYAPGGWVDGDNYTG